jgi:hypothetical protein
MQCSYERADLSYVMLTPSKEHLAPDLNYVENRYKMLLNKLLKFYIL